MRPEIEDLKSLWLHAYSRSSLLQAVEWIEHMNRGISSSFELRALVTAVVVAYARPFTKSQVTPSERMIPLNGVAPPSELLSTHYEILDFRNKVIGHIDALPAGGHSGTPNKVLVRRDATGFDLHTTLPVDMNSETRWKVHKLCGHFISYCDQQVNAVIEKYLAAFPEPPGVYEILITAAPEDWIRPI